MQIKKYYIIAETSYFEDQAGPLYSIESVIAAVQKFMQRAKQECDKELTEKLLSFMPLQDDTFIGNLDLINGCISVRWEKVEYVNEIKSHIELIKDIANTVSIEEIHDGLQCFYDDLIRTPKPEPKKVFFVQRTVMEDGQYVVCIAKEGTKGYWKTDWLYGTNFDLAQEWCNKMNAERGISEKDALMIQAGTM